MSAASGFAASHIRSVCQTSSFIGSRAAHGMSGDEGQESFADNLFSSMSAPLASSYTVSAQLTSIVTEVGVGYALPASQSPSPESIMQLLRGVESEIAQLAGELGRVSGARQAQYSGLQGSGLQGDYRTLYDEATAAVQDGSAFDVKLPSGETLSGKFSWGELEPAGDNALFTPGEPGAPNAGKQAFDREIEQFLSLAQSDAGGTSAAGQIANYTTNTEFIGSETAITWSGSFSLAPADAVPRC
ncbi:MAG TPA: hypothetical protein VF472_04885 [Burkholderiaceae bacterium]